jgi:D-serine deaminase-like pyridoxal phosphate-dependent protein
MQAAADEAGVALRPHVKGHKCAWIAARQLRAGATGLAAATLEEAEGLLLAGLGGDVLLTSDTPASAVDDIVALRRLGDLAVVADEPAFVGALAAAARDPIRVFVDVDVGQRRAGVPSAERVRAVVGAIEAAGSLVFAGVQAYEGHLQLADDADRRAGHEAAMARLAELLDGLGAPVVTSAGTGTAPLALAAAGITEIQPGSYALMDASYAAAGAPFEQAVVILTSVRSVVAPGEVIVDAGLKAVSIDMGPARPDGIAARWSPAGDEHGVLKGDVDLGPGDLVRLVPSHTDTTIRLHRELWLDGAVRLPLI